MASQKETVENFLSGLKNTTAKKAWELFTEQHPTITKANYNFYANKASKAGIWTPAPQTIELSVNLNDNNNYPAAVDRAFEVNTVILGDVDKSKFVGLTTGTGFDIISSTAQGPMRGTVTMVTGESGAGKTTICTNIAKYINKHNKKVTTGFISAEMDRNDWTFECIHNELLADLETVFLLEYLDAPNYLEILVQALSRWDYVVVDSFEVILDQLKELKGWSSKKAESELIKLLRAAAFEQHSCLMVIQQWTKSGGYVGSTKIKHLTTAMIYVMFDDNGERYMVYTKNRRCGHMVGKRLYFTKNKQTGMLEFDTNRLKNVLAVQQHSENNKASLEKDDSEFENILLQRSKALEEVNNDVKGRAVIAA